MILKNHKVGVLPVLGICVAASSPVSIAQDTDASNADATSLTEAIKGGNLLLNARARYEYADQEGLDESNAFTLRTRLGWETAPIYGISGLLEFEDVTILGSEDNFNQAGLSGPGRTVIADVEATEVNQASLTYGGLSDTKITLGRQRFGIGNLRHVGNVGWRQNEQTYDAVTIRNNSLADTSIFYGYVDNVNRVLGDDHPKGDFKSDSHLFNLAYDGLSFGTVTGYAYLLDLENSPANSSDTFGISLNGEQPINDSLSVNYYLEYSTQSDAADNPIDYRADYYRLDLGTSVEGYNFGVGYEVLGSDNGKGYSTPLATLHAYNGWADAFLATPGDGLEDLYFSVGTKLGDVPIKLIYHDFSAEKGGEDYGTEWDLVLSKGLGDHWKATAKFAHFDGESMPDRDKVWVQLDYSF